MSDIKDYPTMTKDELLALAKERELQGVSAASKKEDIVAALELADEEATNAKEPLPSLLPTGIPSAANGGPVVSDVPSDSEYKGSYIKGGEPYALAVNLNDPRGRTHFAKNSVHFWNGTEEEFREQFEKQ